MELQTFPASFQTERDQEGPGRCVRSCSRRGRETTRHLGQEQEGQDPLQPPTTLLLGP